MNTEPSSFLKVIIEILVHGYLFGIFFKVTCELWVSINHKNPGEFPKIDCFRWLYDYDHYRLMSLCYSWKDYNIEVYAISKCSNLNAHSAWRIIRQQKQQTSCSWFAASVKTTWSIRQVVLPNVKTPVAIFYFRYLSQPWTLVADVVCHWHAY